jgi:FHA domain-containing protein/type VI secretion system protein
MERNKEFDMGMMQLILRVESYRNQPPAEPLHGAFDAEGGMLGRAPGNRLVLDDPSKYISRSHASVTLRDGRYYLTDAGSNPSIVNDRPLGPGAEIALGDGDRVVIGDYVLLAALEASASEPASADATMLVPAPAATPVELVAPPLPLFEPPPAPVPTPLPPFEALLPPPAPLPSAIGAGPLDMLAGARILDGAAAPGGNDVLADPLGLNLFGGMTPGVSPASAASRAAEYDHVSPELQAFAPPPAAFMAIPADYDPLADLRAPAAVATAAVMSAPAPAIMPESVAPLSVPPSIALATPPSPPPAASAPPSPAGKWHVAGTDPLPGTYPLPQPPAEAAPAHQAPLPSPPQSLPSPPPAVAEATGAAPVSVSAPASGDRVLQALLEGLGLPQLRSSHAPEDLARLIGEMLRAATAGTMDVLMARALTKRESHIDMTMIAPRANNPLKFFPDADSALTQMLSAQIPGYLPPLPAIAGAFDDLKAHELAVIAGMRAALAAVVQRFDPARIEQRLSDPGRLDKLLPASRKARMWDRLVELYGELARDADEDLQRLFGEKFSGAYEQQVERLRGEAAFNINPTQ